MDAAIGIAAIGKGLSRLASAGMRNTEIPVIISVSSANIAAAALVVSCASRARRYFTGAGDITNQTASATLGAGDITDFTITIIRSIRRVSHTCFPATRTAASYSSQALTTTRINRGGIASADSVTHTIMGSGAGVSIARRVYSAINIARTGDGRASVMRVGIIKSIYTGANATRYITSHTS